MPLESNNIAQCSCEPEHIISTILCHNELIYYLLLTNYFLLMTIDYCHYLFFEGTMRFSELAHGYLITDQMAIATFHSTVFSQQGLLE